MKTSTERDAYGDASRIQREAQAWLRRLTSGEATQLDVDGFRRWRGSSPAHGQAFAEARRVWNMLDPAAARLVSAGLGAVPAAPADRAWRRRAFLGAALGAAGAAGVAAVAPLSLWPGVGEWGADYRTGTGEQRRLDFTDQARVELNTRTALNRYEVDGRMRGVRLIQGEAAVDLPASSTPFDVVAGAGHVIGEAGGFIVRHLDGSSCVTCIEGLVRVEHPRGVRQLAGGQQLSYDDAAVRDVATVNPEEWSAWRQGLLVFRKAPLSRVIDEINRYRSGKVVLWADALRDREVSGRFSIASLDTVLLQIQRSYGLRSQSLPGGVLILS